MKRRIQKALESGDPLTAISEVVDDSRPAGQTFRWAYACILETNSAQLSILFDRFDDGERARIAAALEDIGASNTLADLHALTAAFDSAVASGVDPMDAAEGLTTALGAAAIGRRYEEHVTEMERALLEFCRRRMDEL